MNQGILSGIMVLDFTWMLAGPYATRILGDFGAEVIKVQSKKTAKGAEWNLSPHFNTWNRNKRSITLDMSHPEAQEIVLELVRKSDVVVENFSSRVMSNWGLDYHRLKEVKKDLIMISLSGMGHSGPWKDLVAFGQTIHALSGLTHLAAHSPEVPMGLGFAYADTISGLYGTIAILAALDYRDRTGRGQYIDLSEYEALCTLLGPIFSQVALDQEELGLMGHRMEDVDAVPYGCYRCSGEDRWCVIAVFDDKEWKALCGVSGCPAWARGERFSTAEGRKRHHAELDRLIEQWTIHHEAYEMVHLLQEAGVPAGVIQNAEDLAQDPHLTSRDFFVHLKHPVLGDIISDGSPLRSRGDATSHWKRAPLLGEDNSYVFRELLGFTDEKWNTCLEKGII